MNMIAVKCPVCEKFAIANLNDMCEICGWILTEEDYNDHNHRSTILGCSVNEYKKKWEAKGCPEPPHFNADGKKISHDEWLKTLERVPGTNVYRGVCRPVVVIDEK
jgi:hypothetical protein